jgi:hypothetical protein
MKKTHDYILHYRGYWSDGGKCRIRIYREDRHVPVIRLKVASKSGIPGPATTPLKPHLGALKMR